jgi:hypothetical protein
MRDVPAIREMDSTHDGSNEKPDCAMQSGSICSEWKKKF